MQNKNIQKNETLLLSSFLLKNSFFCKYDLREMADGEMIFEIQ